MIDPTLFRDTFSRLRPSEACVKEIMSMHQKKHTAPRAGLIAAAAVAALCVSAGAVDLATDGALSQSITLAIESVWKVNDYKSVSVMEDGTAMTMYDLTASVETRDGRTFLVIGGEEAADITDALLEEGVYHYRRVDGGTVFEATVTGTPEDWELTTAAYDEGETPGVTLTITSDEVDGHLSAGGTPEPEAGPDTAGKPSSSLTE